MVSLYKHHAPSTTSLSDDADDNDDDIHHFAFNPDLRLLPAQWAFKSNHNALIHRPASRSPISNVPQEIMIQVFKHLHSSKDLYAAMRVSRTWCQCSVELLWHKPSFPRFNTIYKMSTLLRRPDQAFTYSLFIRRLNFLNHGADISDDLINVFARCNRLERLTLIGCQFITGETLAELLPNFSHLVAIDLTGVVGTTSEAMIGLAAVATRLQGINLSGCEKVTDAGIVALAMSCPLLRRVKLSGLTLLTDASVTALAHSCPMLLEIDLNQCELISDVSVRLIWTLSTHMREMRLSHCPLLTDAAFPAPFKPDLQPDIVNPFSNPNARHLDELPPLIINRTFENMRMLDLTACSLITDDAIEGIVSHAPKIRNLVLSKCVLLTDRAVETICRLGRHLHYLHLGHASKITDRSVRVLARTCTRIRYIDFANCVLLTDMSVFELSALPKLRRVGLVRVNQLTDEAIYALAERHATLERIHLSYCDQISVMAIHFLLLKLHKLTHLSLTGVPAFRQTELQKFCREAPKDFNSAQRLAFCVFSGKGVSQLRAYLTELFDRITEMNNTDDTEYEEDDIDSQEDDTPEPEGFNEGRGDRPRQEILVNSNRGAPANTRTDHLYTRQRANFLSQRDNTLAVSNGRNGYNIPTNQPHVPISPSTNVREATARLNAQLQSTIPGAGPSRLQDTASTITLRNNRQHQRAPQQVEGDQRSRQWTSNRTVSDVLPIVESSGRSTPAEAVSGDNGAGFFRTYQERPSVPGISPRENGALTPDLNYAEIGHGRGAQPSSSRAPVYVHVLTPMPNAVPRFSPAPEPPQSASSDSENEVSEQFPEHSTPIAPAAENRWLHLAPGERIEPVVLSGAHAELQRQYERNEPISTTPAELQRPFPFDRNELLETGAGHERIYRNVELWDRPERQSHEAGSSDPRGKSVKRTIRSTINAAEQYASTLFGRSSGEGRPDASGTSSSSNTGGSSHPARSH